MVPIEEQIEVMKAFMNGVKIEFRIRMDVGRGYDWQDWMDNDTDVDFNWGLYDYRVKPVKS